MPDPRKLSPTKSQGAAPTLERLRPRRSHSVGSPTLSNGSGRLSTIIQEYRDRNLGSFVVSPMVRKSILTDTTDIGEPRRQSWWKKLDENSINAMDVLEVNKASEPNNILEELDIEVLSQEKKNYTLDLPESSDSESISSIVIPQRKLFTEKENVPQKQFAPTGQTRDTLGKIHDTNAPTNEKTSTGNRELFASKPRSKPIFPAALLNISPNKTTGDKTLIAAEPKGQVRKIFGNNPGTKRKNMFANFVVSESEDEIPEIQPKIFEFQKKHEASRHPSMTPRRTRNGSSNSSVTTDIEFDDWKLLPSSTMVENQLEAMIAGGQTPKRARLSKLTEDKESDAGTNNTETSNKTKQSNKSTFSKDKSKTTTKEKSPDKNSTIRNKSKLSQNEDTKLNKSQEKQHKSQILSPRNDKDKSLQSSIITRSKNKSGLNNDSPKPTVNNKDPVTNNDKSKSKIISTSFLEPQKNVINSEDGENIPNELNPVEQNNDDELNFTLEYDSDDVNDVHNPQNISNIEPNKEINKPHLSQHSQLQDKSENVNNDNMIIEDNNKENEEVQDKDNDMQVDDVEFNKPINDNQEIEIQTEVEEKEMSQIEKILKSAENIKKVMQTSQGYNEREKNDADDNYSKLEREQIEISQVVNENENQKPKQDEEMELVDNEELENVDEENEEQENLNDDIEQSSQEEEQNESQLEQNESQEIENESQEDQIENESQEDQIENESQEDQIENESQEDQIENESQVDQIESETEQNENEDQQNEVEDEEEEEQIVNESENEENLETTENEQQNSSQEEIDQNERMDQEMENDLANDSASEEVADSDQDHNEDDESNQVIEASDNDSPNEYNQDENIAEIATDTPNISHDTTGRNRKKYESPEAVLQVLKNHSASFGAHGRNTSHHPNQTSTKRTKSLTRYFHVKPSLEPARESIGSDGTKNSSAEGSGWDSHRTTRKTLRQTFGKDFTPRKSLRALVMEKSAKRQTIANDTASVTAKFPVANSTELPDDFSHRDDFDTNVVPEESDHETSRRTRLTMLELYLEKVKKQRMEKEAKIEEEVRNSLKAPVRHNFNVPKPMFPRRPITKTTKPRVKPVKSFIPFEELPEEVIQDMKYKPPKRFQPSNAPWITKRLYKYLESKLEPKYDYKARVRSEKFVETLYNFSKGVRRRDGVASIDAVEVLKHEMARLDIVKTHFDFYDFFHEFMPRDIRVKVIPDVVNKIPEPRGGVFADILKGNNIMQE